MYGTKFDSNIKTAVRFGSSVGDLLAHETIRDVLTEVNALLTPQEEAGASASAAGDQDARDADGPVAGLSTSIIATLPEDTLQRVAGFGQEDADALAEFDREAGMLVASYIKVIDSRDRELSLIAALRDSTVGTMRGSGDGHVVAFYDIQCASEHKKIHTLIRHFEKTIARKWSVSSLHPG